MSITEQLTVVSSILVHERFTRHGSWALVRKQVSKFLMSSLDPSAPKNRCCSWGLEKREGMHFFKFTSSKPEHLLNLLVREGDAKTVFVKKDDPKK